MQAEQIFAEAYDHGLRFCVVIAISAPGAYFLARRKTEWCRGFSIMTWVWCIVNTIVAIMRFNHIRVPNPDQLAFAQGHSLFWMLLNLVFDFFVIVSGLLAYFIGRFQNVGNLFLGLAAGWATQGLLPAILDAYFISQG
ncbi:MAG: hypothetical protein J4F31_00830 [Flavobacteriales bacterium]|nr:hypothetical protein [Flavobacteriales bacterium]